MQPTLNPHSALIHVMVMTACVDSKLDQSEIDMMSNMIRLLPVFRSYDRANLSKDAEACLAYLEREDGIDELIEAVAEVLPENLAETAYALACDVAAADGTVTQTELEALMIIRQTLGVGRLPAAAIERGARARAMTL